MEAMIRNATNSLAILTRIDSSWVHVWHRNFYYFTRTIWISLLFLFLEPILYFGAIGYGLGFFVGHIDGMSYLSYFLPGLVSITAMMISFFESSYGAFGRFQKLNSFGVILMAPITSESIVLGEIFWGATKGFFAAGGVLGLAVAFQVVKTSLLGPALAVTALGCIIFSSFGILAMSYAKDKDFFIYTQSLVMLPLSLFSDTYFPVESIHRGLSALMNAFPLVHLAHILRNAYADIWTFNNWLSLAVLLVYALVLTNWSVFRMRQKIYS